MHIFVICSIIVVLIVILSFISNVFNANCGNYKMAFASCIKIARFLYYGYYALNPLIIDSIRTTCFEDFLFKIELITFKYITIKGKNQEYLVMYFSCRRRTIFCSFY